MKINFEVIPFAPAHLSIVGASGQPCAMLRDIESAQIEQGEDGVVLTASNGTVTKHIALGSDQISISADTEGGAIVHRVYCGDGYQILEQGGGAA